MKGGYDVGCNQFEDEVYDEERLLHRWEEDCAERNYGAFDGGSGDVWSRWVSSMNAFLRT